VLANTVLWYGTNDQSRLRRVVIGFGARLLLARD